MPLRGSFPVAIQFPSPFLSLTTTQNSKPQCQSPISRTSNSSALPSAPLLSSRSAGFLAPKLSSSLLARRGRLHICRDSGERGNFEGRIQEKEIPLPDGGDGGGGDGAGSWTDWSASILLFGLWAGLMYYVFQLAPNQTPYRDTYFLQKLLNLRGDDGFRMNEVLVALWYVMGLWPLVYSMLLLPTGRSSRSKFPVWPFVVLSFFGGAYALIPYFVLWKPPPPAVEEEELKKWPLNFLESKLTAGISVAAGLGLIAYAGLAEGSVWKEFFQYFRESKFIHITCLDFSLLSAFSPFWVYNDMTARRWINKGSWLLPVSVIPFLGPAVYLLLRPPLSSLLTNTSTTADAE